MTELPTSYFAEDMKLVNCQPFIPISQKQRLFPQEQQPATKRYLSLLLNLEFETFTFNKNSELLSSGYHHHDTDQWNLCCRLVWASYLPRVCSCNPVVWSFGCILESPGKLLQRTMDAQAPPLETLIDSDQVGLPCDLILQPELSLACVIQSPFRCMNPWYSSSTKCLYNRDKQPKCSGRFPISEISPNSDLEEGISWRSGSERGRELLYIKCLLGYRSIGKFLFVLKAFFSLV